MNHTLKSLKGLYELDRKDAASMLAMLASLEPGEEFTSLFGRIVKTDHDSFKIEFSRGSIAKIIAELADDKGLKSIFD